MMMEYLKSIYRFSNSAFSGLSKVRLGAVLLLSAFNALINLGTPYFLLQGYSILLSRDEENDSAIAFYMMGYGALWGVSRLLSPLRMMLLAGPTSKMAHTMVSDVLRSYYDRPMQYRASSNSAAEVQHFSNAYEHIAKNFLTAFLSRAVPSIFEIIAASIILFWKLRLVAISLLATALSYFFVLYFSSRFVAKAQSIWMEKAFEAFESVTERLNQYENAHYNGGVGHELKQLDQNLDQFDKQHRKTEYIRETANIIQVITVAGGFTGIIAWSAYYTNHEKVNIDDFIWVILYLTQFTLALDELSKALNFIGQSYINFKEIHDYLTEEHHFSHNASLPNLVISSKKPEIIFNNIFLKYPDKEDFALKNLNFTISPGQRVVIIGESGSGKSSIMQLLLGFYKPTAGTIKISGYDITSVNHESLRELFAVVPQNPYLINDTIIENIKYACQDASEQEIIHVIEKARLIKAHAQFGYTKIGDQGKKLSGGQRQRISIARAILRLNHFAEIVIADEPTAALDSKTESIIMDEVATLCRDKTSFLITHNLRLVCDYPPDIIFVMDKGEIIEFGSYDSLISDEKSHLVSMLQSAGIDPGIKNLLSPGSNRKEKQNSDIEVLNEDFVEESISNSMDFSSENLSDKKWGPMALFRSRSGSSPEKQSLLNSSYHDFDYGAIK